MHLHQKDKIQSLLNVLRPQPNLEHVIVNIFPHSPHLYYTSPCWREKKEVLVIFLLDGRDLELRPPQAD